MKKNLKLKSLLVFSASLLAYAAAAQNSIFTDRPNVTDAVALLPTGTFQVELGYFRESSNDGDLVNRTSPNVNIKYGLTEWIELRVLTNYLNSNADTPAGEIEASGLTPIAISPKVRLLKTESWLTNVSLSTNFILPSTSD